MPSQSVHIDDAVSIYEPDTTKSSYCMRSATIAKSRYDTGRKMSNHNERQQFFLNKLFRTVSPKTPANSFRHNFQNNGSHDERSNNDESTNTSVLIDNNSFSNRSIHQISMAPIREYAIVEDAKTQTNSSSTNGITMNLPPSPIAMDQLLSSKNQPERRKVFMDKLFTVSRMHVSEAGITSLQSPNKSTMNNKNNSSGNTRNGRRLVSRKILTPQITYSLDGDTTTTNSSVGVEEDTNDLSSTSSTKSKSPKPAHAATFSTPDESATTTILMDLPKRQQVMKIQTDRTLLPNDKNETTSTTTRITNLIAPNYATSIYKDFKFTVAPEFSQLSPQQDELPPPILPSSNKMGKELRKVSKDNRNKNNIQSVVSTATLSDGNPNDNKASTQQEWQQYFGRVLDNITQITCINTCSDLDLVRCDDIEEYSPSKRSRGTNKDIVTPSSGYSLMVLQSSNSMYTTEDDDNYDLGTYDESLLSTSLFDTEPMEDELTYTKFHDDNDMIPLHLHQSLFSSPPVSSSHMDDDGTSFSSQNSAWV
jgi:hypothetical protein